MRRRNPEISTGGALSLKMRWMYSAAKVISATFGNESGSGPLLHILPRKKIVPMICMPKEAALVGSFAIAGEDVLMTVVIDQAADAVGR